MNITQQHIDNFKEYNKNAIQKNYIFSLHFFTAFLFILGQWSSSKTIISFSELLVLLSAGLNILTLVIISLFKTSDPESDIFQKQVSITIEHKRFISYDLERTFFANFINDLFNTRTLLLITNIVLLYYFNYHMLSLISMLVFIMNYQHTLKNKYLVAIFIATQWRK